MRYGYWMPVFGGWLRNVEDEQMSIGWDYISKLARRSEENGFSLTLIAELNLNDIKGVDAPSLDAWSTAAALAAVTKSLELMVAVRPTFHLPALLAKQAANIDNISNGRVSLNVVSSWWAEEAKKYGVQFDEHDDRYARTSEWLISSMLRGKKIISPTLGNITRSRIWYYNPNPSPSRVPSSMPVENPRPRKI